MLSNKTVIKGQWKKISLAGEDGVAWINKYTGNTEPVVLIAHTDTIQTHGSPVGDNIPWGDALDLDVDTAYQLPPDGRISDELFADNGNDIFYATIKHVGESVDLTVDFG
jgi:hypothetical protein